MTKIALIDPTSLVGKELARLLPTWPGLSPTVDSFHTGTEEEHRVAEVGGGAALVAPLDDPMVLAGYDGVLTAGREATPRMTALAEALDELPQELPVVDAARAPVLRAATRVAAPAAQTQELPLHFRVPDPSVVATLHVLEAVSGLRPLAAGIHSEEPVSVLGPGAVQALARQAAARLQGEPAPTEELGAVLAFNFRGLPDDGAGAEASALLAPVEVSLTRAAVGRFHGHVVHLSLLFPEAISAETFETLCRSSESLRMAPAGLDMAEAPDSGSILVGPPSVSSSGRLLTVTATLDGLLFGGARTALELLDSLF
ncbi:MAG: hypothetical protein GXP47_12505 [Acidobacteria bacterium]|nr:hypothetical protein [Acidobacteriota bacterium]